MTDLASRQAAAAAIAARYAELGAEAVLLAGSESAGTADRHSDLDLYVYGADGPSLECRAAVARERHALRAEIGNRFWEDGDEWDEPVGDGAVLHVDVMFRRPAWIEGELARVLDRCEASLGYTTALWHNVATSRILFDRRGWAAGLKRSAARPYPEALARAIIAKNTPLLRGSFAAYPRQIERAAERRDAVAVNHRIAALLASYFDVIFALNRTPHPGEKRLLAAAGRLPIVPDGMAAQVEALLAAPLALAEVAARAERLASDLDRLLRDRGELPPAEDSR